jgi:hypothetical protein
MTWATQTIHGKPVAVFAPPEARFTVLYLHEHDEPVPTANAELTAALGEHRLACLAPHDAGAWWANRVHPPFDPTVTAEAFLLQLLSSPPLASLGGQAAVRLGFRHPRLVPVVAAWDADFDFHERYGNGSSLDELYARKEQARQDTAVLQVRQNDYPPHVWFGCPADSERFRGNDRLHEKLAAVGVPHEFVTAEARPFAAMVAFAADALSKQSRRLL